jgi:ATP-binding cassette subfamily B (MDR/TAP) protein 1
MPSKSSIELTDTLTKSPPSKRDGKSRKKKKENVSMLRLFRFATPMERVLILIATICSAGSGPLLPVSIIVYGNFISNVSATLTDYSQLLNLTYPVIYTMVYMETAMLVASYISSCL